MGPTEMEGQLSRKVWKREDNLRKDQWGHQILDGITDKRMSFGLGCHLSIFKK